MVLKLPGGFDPNKRVLGALLARSEGSANGEVEKLNRDDVSARDASLDAVDPGRDIGVDFGISCVHFVSVGALSAEERGLICGEESLRGRFPARLLLVFKDCNIVVCLTRVDVGAGAAVFEFDKSLLFVVIGAGPGAFFLVFCSFLGRLRFLIMSFFIDNGRPTP